MFMHLVWLNVKARLQYGRSFVYEILTSMVGYIFEFLAVWIIINQFNSIIGWSFFEILFLHALGYFVRATASAFLWRPMWLMSDYMQRGQLDKFLLSPVNSFMYIVGSNFMTYALSHVILGGMVAIISIFFIPIDWTLLKALLFICSLIGAMFIYGGFIVFSGAISFWTVRSSFLLRVLTEAWSVINYPITIYPRSIQILLTFFIPFALLNYYPTVYLFRQPGNSNSWTMILILAAGLSFFTLVYKLWWYGVRKYQGAGS